MIPHDKHRLTVVKGMREHLGCLIIRQNQDAPAPAYPYGCYSVTMLESANNGTWERYEDGTSRKMVKQTWSLSFQSDSSEESIALATEARDWLMKTGRVYLKDNGIIVQSVTNINNRDNFLTAGYEYKHGFDVVFYLYDTVETTEEYIESAETNRTTTI